ncbi:glycosyltransferase family 4 protein [[Micrococcus luteus] ATCC 49442]|uniref:glycosyltransferase family 4 protein n=1 Tax=[Micrococcus luteus] ATCC 49442 TaxID=2698727 RepID=UPI0013DCA517|nr:glycosyltransferase family 4 protein [[Micrococcus luteus] ATCC 49442]
MRDVSGVQVTYVGANWSELEFMRYTRRTELDEVLNSYDAVVGVFGTPAQCLMLRSLRVPHIAKIATLVSLERRQLLRSLTGLRRLAATLNLLIAERLDKKGLYIPQHLMVINDWMFKYCGDRVGARVELAPPGIDTDLYVPYKHHSADRSPAEAALPKIAPYFLFVGRLADPRKDIKSLLRSYKIAREKFGLTQKLVLAGRGDIQPDEYELIAQLQLQDEVEIHRDVSPTSLPGLYQAADVFVLASAEEGLGIVLLEAMSSGIPVVSSATEGARYAVGDDEVGTLVEFGPDFTETFAASLAMWATDPAARERAGLKGRERVLSRFSFQAAGEKYLSALAVTYDRVS